MENHSHRIAAILLLCAAVFLALPKQCGAQDFHLSQYDVLPLYYNPATTGMYPAGEKRDYRFCGSYRSQWQKLSGKPYSSVGVAYDMPMKKYGVGLLVMDHIAGSSNFATLQFLASGAYRITSRTSKNHFLSTGFQIGFFQKRFSTGDLLFENQYTETDGLDPNIPNGENSTDLSILRLDANMGMYYRYLSPNKKWAPSVGFSVYHFNTPNESFTGQVSRLPMRFNGIFSCDIRLGEECMITPSALMMYQGQATEMNLGMMVGYRIGDSEYSLLGGSAWRKNDACVLHFGLKQGANTFRISYDIITSPLKNAGGGRGGFEMGVIYAGLLKGKSPGRTMY